MGITQNVGMDAFPRQGEYLSRKVNVYFNFDTSKTIGGEIVRDDVSEPFITIIKLEDGRHVLSKECQYNIK